jgi:hypothetical protein
MASAYTARVPFPHVWVQTERSKQTMASQRPPTNAAGESAHDEEDEDLRRFLALRPRDFPFL